MKFTQPVLVGSPPGNVQRDTRIIVVDDHQAGWHCFGVFGKAVVFVFSGDARSSSGGR